ncbi:MAG: hypothetical protein K2Q03_04945 [Sphingobacteriaceae bacterium]|nr:hypothetical protein [Sphingobacteriaceae bacterium]
MKKLFLACLFASAALVASATDKPKKEKCCSTKSCDSKDKKACDSKDKKACDSKDKKACDSKSKKSCDKK